MPSKETIDFPLRFLYLVMCADMVKVGITANLPGRLKSLRDANPFDLYFYRAWIGQKLLVMECERRVKKRFLPQRVRGEWFSITAQQAEDVVLCCLDEPREEWLHVIHRELTGSEEVLSRIVVEQLRKMAPSYVGSVMVGSKKIDVPNYY